MAFDQATRNRLQRFVNDARRVLEEEFTRQLQNDYGMDPNAGSVADLSSLRHINDAQRETARILRDTLAHYTASGDMNASQGLDRIVREQAFTVLNRLAALRMAETRGLLVESVGNGFQAKGFQLYARLAGTGLGETGDAYRVYLFSVFDELAQDLPGLFDRYSPQGRLFPREAALLQVLNLINDADIAPLWAEDETIGWIYQYFNSKEERKAMREASQAPRNSRELAVRNQFFTPRYVVEFLVDNTLGRLWLNATAGATGLRDRCQYLLVKPDETPQAATKLRDPRSLKLLDPACGSMHFGLYAFDLFAEIYREAWAWEQQHGPGSLDVSTQSKAAFKPLTQTYEDETAFLQDVPRLIIEHNIYGVDIDPRAAQIASLALWLRAQRAWHDAGVKAKDRPPIGRGHVLAAIAPPAERELRQQFVASLDKRDAELFEKTLQMLKGLPELGVLLQVERELPHLIRQVYVGKGTGLFAEQEQAAWQQAEARLRAALTEFAQAAKATYQGRLFAQDALQGLRLIDLCREVFDVVVMNPPFGDASPAATNYLDSFVPDWCKNLAAAFVSRMRQLMHRGSYIGCVTDKTILIKSSYEPFRQSCVLGDSVIGPVADLGWGVLDDANVEVTAAIFTVEGDCTRKSGFIDCRSLADKDSCLLRCISSGNDIYWIEPELFYRIPHSSIAYEIPSFILEWFGKHPPLQDSGARALQGHAIKMDWYARLWWEVNIDSIGEHSTWCRMYNGGGFSRFGMPSVEIVRWNSDGTFLKSHPSTRWSNADSQQLPGVGYGKRGDIVDAHVVQRGHIFTVEGLFILPDHSEDVWYYLGLLNSPITSVVLNLYCGQHKHAGYVNLLPTPSTRGDAFHSICEVARQGFSKRIEEEHTTENSVYFSGLLASAVRSDTGYFEIRVEYVNELRESLKRIESKCASVSEALYELTEQQRNKIAPQLVGYLGTDENDDEFAIDARGFNLTNAAEELVSFLVGTAFSRWKTEAIFEGPVPKERLDPNQPLPSRSPAMHEKSSECCTSLLEQDQLIRAVHNSMSAIFRDAESVELEMLSHLRKTSLFDFLTDNQGFFQVHLKNYSKGRKQAPIYWPLSTPSGRFILWLYYPCIHDQTLYTAINDFVEPKLKQVGADVTALRNKGSARTRDDEKQFEALQALELELIDLRDALLKLAPTYKPNHDDGVQITAAPLWPMFRHKPWQQVLKDTWVKLEKGDYDWAHLAMNYWPDRVREKCKTDKSLAIAHGLEHLYVEPEAQPKKTRGRKRSGGDE